MIDLKDSDKWEEVLKDNPSYIFSVTEKYYDLFILSIYKRSSIGDYIGYKEYIFRDNGFINNNGINNDIKTGKDLFNCITNNKYTNEYIRSPYELIKQYAFKDDMGIILKQSTVKTIIESDNNNRPVLKDICIEMREIQDQLEESYYND